VSWLPYVVAAWLVVVGLWGIVTSRHLVHAIVCVAILQAATYVLLAAVGWRDEGKAPVFADLSSPLKAVDPVTQALMLTDVVVEATVFALLLALAVQVHKNTGELDPNALKTLRG
jgi:multicomponent Na+:H+ antiporter subunit C